MSHKAGHIIIQSLKASAPLTTDQTTRLNEIETRNEYTLTDRIYIGYVSYVVAPLPATEHEH